MKRNLITKLITGVFIVILVGMESYQAVSAQPVRVGVNYTYRNAEPKSGFGILLEPTVYSISRFDIDVRGSFNTLNTQDSRTYFDETFNIKVNHYDVCVDALGRLKFNYIDPYIALGVGYTSYKIVGRGYSQIKTGFLYDGSVGLELNPIPYIKPFVEYKYTRSNVNRAQILLFNPNNSFGQLEVGLNVKF
ncbi:MAG TPA: outer membrane beta-barrel protein [Balneolales bacterium]|nr:outer membrane beta-barrel protein [Balneolales bacterium]